MTSEDGTPASRQVAANVTEAHIQVANTPQFSSLACALASKPFRINQIQLCTNAHFRAYFWN